MSGVSDPHRKLNYILLSNVELFNVCQESVINSGHIHFRSTFWNRNRLSPELFVQYQYNNNLGLNNRGLAGRSEEHTSELQSRGHLVCRLLLEKKKTAPYHYRLREHRLVKCI